jgi:hypothetical protein
MKNVLSYLVFAMVLGVSWHSLSTASNAKHKGALPAPARVHFSGNLEGELEPCG